MIEFLKELKDLMAKHNAAICLKYSNGSENMVLYVGDVEELTFNYSIDTDTVKDEIKELLKQGA